MTKTDLVKANITIEEMELINKYVETNNCELEVYNSEFVIISTKDNEETIIAKGIKEIAELVNEWHMKEPITNSIALISNINNKADENINCIDVISA